MGRGAGAVDFGRGGESGREVLANGFPREVGGVAVLAQVGEKDVAEVFGGDFGDEFRGGLVREVTVAGEDALFD